MGTLTQSLNIDGPLAVHKVALTNSDWDVSIDLGSPFATLFLSTEQARKLATDLLDIVGWGQPELLPPYVFDTSSDRS